MIAAGRAPAAANVQLTDSLKGYKHRIGEYPKPGKQGTRLLASSRVVVVKQFDDETLLQSEE